MKKSLPFAFTVCTPIESKLHIESRHEEQTK